MKLTAWLAGGRLMDGTVQEQQVEVRCLQLGKCALERFEQFSPWNVADFGGQEQLSPRYAAKLYGTPQGSFGFSVLGCGVKETIAER